MRLSLRSGDSFIEGNSKEYLLSVNKLSLKDRIIEFIDPLTNEIVLTLEDVSQEELKTKVKNVNLVFNNLINQPIFPLLRSDIKSLNKIMNNIADDYLVDDFNFKEKTSLNYYSYSLKNLTIIKNPSINYVANKFFVSLKKETDLILGKIRGLDKELEKTFDNKERRKIEKSKTTLFSQYSTLDSLNRDLGMNLDGLKSSKKELCISNIKDIIDRLSLNNVDYNDKYLGFIPRFRFMNISEHIKDLLKENLVIKKEKEEFVR